MARRQCWIASMTKQNSPGNTTAKIVVFDAKQGGQERHQEAENPLNPPLVTLSQITSTTGQA